MQDALPRSSDPSGPCPDAEALQAYASGALEDPRSQRTEDHLAHCTQCSLVVGRFGLREADGRPLTVGRYRLLDWVGESDDSVVYRAWDPRLCRCVALKVFAPESIDPTATQRRLGQARSLIRLSHRHVARVLDTDLDDSGQLFIVTELVTGPTLDGWLRARPRAWTEVVSVFRRLARGLAAAHAVSVHHGDLRPTNVLLGDDGRVCVCDFSGPTPRAGARPRDDVRQLSDLLAHALAQCDRASARSVPRAILRAIEAGQSGRIDSMEALLGALDKPAARLRTVLIGPAIGVGILIGLASAYALAG